VEINGLTRYPGAVRNVADPDIRAGLFDHLPGSHEDPTPGVGVAVRAFPLDMT
jgi:hypothetical protein